MASKPDGRTKLRDRAPLIYVQEAVSAGLEYSRARKDVANKGQPANIQRIWRTYCDEGTLVGRVPKPGKLVAIACGVHIAPSQSHVSPSAASAVAPAPTRWPPKIVMRLRAAS